MGETFANQDLADVPSADRQHSTKPPIVAAACPFLSWSAGARHSRQPGIAGGDKTAEALGCFLCPLPLVVAARPVAALWSIETNQPITVAIHPHGITVDHLNRIGASDAATDLDAIHLVGVFRFQEY